MGISAGSVQQPPLPSVSPGQSSALDFSGMSVPQTPDVGHALLGVLKPLLQAWKLGGGRTAEHE